MRLNSMRFAAAPSGTERPLVSRRVNCRHTVGIALATSRAGLAEYVRIIAYLGITSPAAQRSRLIIFLLLTIYHAPLPLSTAPYKAFSSRVAGNSVPARLQNAALNVASRRGDRQLRRI